MRVCLVYDCLFPWTVGGAERWMRNVAEALAADGHEVTFLTRLQWDPADPPQIDGVTVVAVSKEEPLYGPDGNRTIGEPLRFGYGVLRHLTKHGGDYDVVHTASFPYFSLLAAGVARRRHGYRLIADWHEVWSSGYWREYLGGPKGRIAQVVQRMCVRTRQDAFCFSDLHAVRLREEGLKDAPTVLRGEWAGTLQRPTPVPAEPLVVFAGRMIPEKRAPVVVEAVAIARRTIPGLRAEIFGDGPQLPAVRAEIERLDAAQYVRAPGFVATEEIDETLRRALCLLLPSTREGYGMIVVEAAAAGVPSVLVRAPDNAAVELLEDGVNGVVAAEGDAQTIAAAIVKVHEAGDAMRTATADWFAAHAHELSIQTSLDRVLAAYSSAA